MKTAKPTPLNVAIYVRASSDEQTASCPDQLKAWRAEAKKRGYCIVREYIDEGKSGSREIHKRQALHEMVADSAKHTFTRICVWDSSRFGRLDALDGAEHKSRLRKNGVEGLESLREGFVNWNDSMGRMQDALLSEAAHKYARDLGANSVRGRISKLEAGAYPHGMIPFGYDREYTFGGQILLIPREQKFRATRGWTRKLVVNPQEADTVRLIYDLYVNKSLSMLGIMKELAARGIKGWGGRPMPWKSIQKILTDKSYIGYTVVQKTKPCNRREAFTRIPAAEVPGIIPAIITDEQIWYDAQRLHKHAGFGNRTDKSERILNGVLICGKCGYRLVARQRKLKSGKLGLVFYSCSSASRSPHACPQWRAWEHEVLPAVIAELVKVVDAEIIGQLAIPKGKSDPAAAMVKEVEDLKVKVKRAVLRAATIEDELLAEYQEIAADLRQQLTTAEEKLRMHRHVQTEGGPALWTQWWGEIRPGLVLESDDPELIEDVLAQHQLLPVLASVRGEGGLDEFKRAARQALIRLAEDGDTDPFRAIVVKLFKDQVDGVLVDATTLRGVLRRLGCSVSLFWRKDEKGLFVLDRGSLKIEFRWQHTAGTTNTSGSNGVLAVYRTAVIHFGKCPAAFLAV